MFCFLPAVKVIGNEMKNPPTTYFLPLLSLSVKFLFHSFVCLSVCLFVCLSVCLFACLFYSSLAFGQIFISFFCLFLFFINFIILNNFLLYFCTLLFKCFFLLTYFVDIFILFASLLSIILCM